MLFAVGRSLGFSVPAMLAMPLAQLFQFAHCALLEAGCDTAWTNRTREEQAEFDEICEFLRKQKK